MFRNKDGDFLWGRFLRVVIPSLIIFIALLANIFTIRAGEIGVGFNPFVKYRAYDPTTGQQIVSAVNPQEYSEGIHIKLPWVKITKFNTKTQDYTMSVISEEGEMARDDRIRTVTSEGLYVGLDITVLFRINSARVDEIRRTIGVEGDYQQIVVRPAIRSVIREVVSRFEAAAIYGIGRAEVQAQISRELENLLGPRGITVQAVLLRDVELPEQITAAIEAKKQAEQEAMRMIYVLQKEELEKQRKLIEAQGISAANKEISGSLTNAYLTWYWINNLHNHESVVYMIPSDQGLPLFKNVP